MPHIHLDQLGTVAVTGASGQVGRALLRRLSHAGVPTIAFSRHATDLPADRIIVGPLDSPAASVALRDAELVVHLAGALRPATGDTYHGANLATADVVARALAEGPATRVLFLSYVGAHLDSPNAYLRMKAAAEHRLAETGKEVVVFRCTHIVGPPEAPGPTASALMAGPGQHPRVVGTGRQRVAPVYLGDVVEALLTGLVAGAPGSYDLAGPDEMAFDDLVRLLNGDPGIPIIHVPTWAAQLLSLFVPSLPGPLIDLLRRDSLGDARATCAAFTLSQTSLLTVWSWLESCTMEIARSEARPRVA